MIGRWTVGEGAKHRVINPEYAGTLDLLDHELAARAAEMTAEGRLG